MRKFLFISLLVVATVVVGGTAEEPFGDKIAGEPVCRDEYAFYESSIRSEVAAWLMREHGLRPSPEFWSSEVGGASVGWILRRETIAAIARARAVQELAAEAGLIDGVRPYRQLVEAFHEENRRRKQMRERGEVFYGPVRFRQEVWFEVWQDQLVRELRIHARARFDSDETLEAREAAARDWVEARIRRRAGHGIYTIGDNAIQPSPTEPSDE